MRESGFRAPNPGLLTPGRHLHTKGLWLHPHRVARGVVAGRDGITGLDGRFANPPTMASALVSKINPRMFPAPISGHAGGDS